MVRPMVMSEKHYVQFSLATVTGGAVVTNDLVLGVAVSDKNAVNEVREGSLVKAVYFELWVRAGETTAGSGQLIVEKVHDNANNPSAAEMAALGTYPNKRNILYTTMGLFNDQDADAIAAFKGWIKIPKGKQRMALGDELRFSIFAPTIDLHICGFTTYKEYF